MTKTPWGNADEQRSRRLSPGPGTPPAEVERNQRERLLAATVAAVAVNGYEATRVADVLAISGVSRSAFYKHFQGKQECFLATFDAIADLATSAVAAAYGSERRWEERLRAVLEALVEMAVDQPAAARLVLVDAYAAGPAAVARLDRVAGAAEEMLAAAFAESPAQREMPREIVRALVGGITTTMRRRLADGPDADLRSLVPELLDWALSYRPPPRPLRSDAGAATRVAASPQPASQEQRLMASLLQTFAEQGYAATTIADVARQAKISLTTFYAFFAGKQEALLAVLDHIRETAGNAARAGRARRPESWRSTVRDGLEALLGALDAEPALARVALAEPGIEPRARDHGCSTLALDTVLCPEHPEAPPITPTANAAIGGAILTLIARPAPGHGARSFSASTPVATYVALAPFIGPANACSTANEPRATPP